MTEYLQVYSSFKNELIQALGETLIMMGVSMLASLILGLALGSLLFITSSQGISKKPLLYSLLSALVNLVRSIPYVLFIIVLIPLNRIILGTGFGVKASTLPLSIVGIALYARLVEKDLQDQDRNLYEAAYSMGASKFQYLKDFLFKEARSSLVLSFTSTSLSLLSYSTVMGFIGGGGLGYLAISEGYQNFNYKLMWIIILIMVIMVQLTQAAGNLLAAKLNKK